MSVLIIIALICTAIDIALCINSGRISRIEEKEMFNCEVSK